MTSLTNKIVANIKSTASNSFTYINSENVVCIDSSNNRIGINTKTPQYSIHVSGGTIKSKDLIIDNSAYILGIADIFNISANYISARDISVDTIDISNFCTFTTISGNHIDTITISSENISITDTIDSSNITCKFIDISKGTIDCSDIIVKDISCDNIKTNTLSQNNFSTVYINVSNITIIEELSTNNLFVDNHATILDLSVTNLEISENASFKFASFNDISINGEASFNTINIEGSANFNGNIIANSLQITRLQINRDENGDFQPLAEKIKSDISQSIYNLDVSNLTIHDNLISYAKNDLSQATLLIPIVDNSNTDLGNLYYDTSKNQLNIYNNNKFKYSLFENNYATLKLNTSISGNNIAFNNNYYIENSNILIYRSNYKYIPITFDTSFGVKFDINNTSRTLSIQNYNIDNSDNIFEIQSNISIKYLNKTPNDVEANNYTFGIYSEGNTTTPYASIKNSIIVIDNSYNYATSSLNYIGNNISGIDFYVNSEKDINYLVIDSFNCTIKQLA